MSDKLINTIVELCEDDAINQVKEMLEQGVQPLEILNSTRKAVEIIGERYEEGKYFLPELMMTGEILKKIVELTKGKMVGTTTEDDSKYLGKVVIGTAQGDIHYIGKNIVTFMLDINGFKVIDLGEDVPPAKFVAAINEHQPQIVGISALLTLAFDKMKDTVQAIDDAGLRDKVKIMIGGAPINEKIKEFTGADGWGKDAVEAVSLAKKWMGGN
ncbi:MAG: cobalamin B12-binding domain-containing protein [Candidatus Atribacteria bacterium]|nr:cobalamin B12-binding domain-containing protein [Candidatus Atribacteria bacterium]